MGSPGKSSGGSVARWFVCVVIVAAGTYPMAFKAATTLPRGEVLVASGAGVPLAPQIPTTNHTTAIVDAIHIPSDENDERADDPTVCFLVSIYGKWAKHADKLQNVRRLAFYNHTRARFLAFTNMPKLPVPGWERLVRPYPRYTRYITQSRYPKFFGWNDTAVVRAGCEVVFYMDAIGHIVGNWSEVRKAARAIRDSPEGHAQYPHRGGGGAMGEFRRIEVFQKDTDEHIRASKEWLQGRHDFSNNCTLYENRYIGYSTKPTSQFRKAAAFFWERYSLELDSWRDQPLWCYALDALHLTPTPLDHKKLWVLRTRRMGKHGHKYATEDQVAN